MHVPETTKTKLPRQALRTLDKLSHGDGPSFKSERPRWKLSPSFMLRVTTGTLWNYLALSIFFSKMGAI